MNRIIKAKIPSKSWGHKYIMECLWCHKDFPIDGTRYRIGSGKFCSTSCHVSNKNSQNKGEKHNHWKGGRIVTSFGYVRIYSPKHPSNRFGYVLEHRLVMEKKIGRYLTKEEVVHHLNGVKNDNRPENLAILEAGEHTHHHYPYIMTGVVRDTITGKFLPKHN